MPPPRTAAPRVDPVIRRIPLFAPGWPSITACGVLSMSWAEGSMRCSPRSARLRGSLTRRAAWLITRRRPAQPLLADAKARRRATYRRFDLAGQGLVQHRSTATALYLAGFGRTSVDCRVCADLENWQAGWLPAGCWGSSGCPPVAEGQGVAFFPPSRPRQRHYLVHFPLAS